MFRVGHFTARLAHLSLLLLVEFLEVLVYGMQPHQLALGTRLIVFSDVLQALAQVLIDLSYVLSSNLALQTCL